MSKVPIIFIMALGIFATGCKNDDNNPINPQTQENGISFEIKATDYSDSDFLLDTTYEDTSDSLNMFYKYYGSDIPLFIEKYKIIKAEIYISINNIYTKNSILANAYINLPTRNASQLYPDLYRGSATIDTAGVSSSARFEKLNEGTDYRINYYAGWLSLNFDPQDQQVIAAAYEIEGDNPGTLTSPIYGEFSDDIINNHLTRIVLKLIKPSNLFPGMDKAWKLKLKNIYKTNDLYTSIRSLDMNIYLNENNIEVDKIGNTKFIYAFGFDRYSQDGNSVADGKFDFRPGITFVPTNGKILFPELEPFGKNLPVQLGDSLKREDIYVESKKSLDTLNHVFRFKGNYIPISHIRKKTFVY